MSTTEAPSRATSAVPTFEPPATGMSLHDMVPIDRLRAVRAVLMVGYLATYLWWLRAKGLPVDRISVAISVGIFLVCAFIGKSWRTWGVLLLDSVAYCLMWVSYEKTRGTADVGIDVFGWFHLDFPLQVESMRNIDRAMFFGHDPNVVLQKHFLEKSVRWYDVVASVTYMTHFVVPIIVLGVLWATSHRQWARFMKRFATVIAVGCVMFVTLPTAPPWMVGDRKYPYQLFSPLRRTAGRGFNHLGFHSFTNDYNIQLSNGNAVAAMPSLHASFALIVPAFFLPWIKPKWLKALALTFPVIMLTSLVYLGEHWVHDGLVGWAITGATFWFWNWRERRIRENRADSAQTSLTTAEDPA